jgi:hypothetical protein
LPPQSSPSLRPSSRLRTAGRFPARRPRLAQRLALSRDQLIQFRGINKDRKTQVDAVQADASLSPQVRRQKIKAIHADAESKVRGMLNQNQLEEYDQIKRERHEEAVRRRETDPPPQQ